MRTARFVLAPLSLALVLTLVGCDSGGEPGDEAFEIAQVRLALSPTDGPGSGTQTVLLDATGVLDGALEINRGTTYRGTARFFDAGGVDVTDRALAEPERIQVLYAVSGTRAVAITVTDSELTYGANDFGQSLPVGAAFSVTSPLDAERGSASLRVQIGRFATDAIKNGSSIRGAEVFDALVPFTIGRAGPEVPSALPVIDRIRVDLSWTDFNNTPINTGFEISGGAVTAATAEVDTLRLRAQAVTEATVRFFSGQTEFTDQLRAESLWYRVLLDAEGPDAFVLQFDEASEDEEGQPFAQTFVFRPEPPNLGRRFPRLRIRLGYYDPATGTDKMDAPTQILAGLTIPFEV